MRVAPRRAAVVLAIAVVFAIVPTAVLASYRFNDVPDSNTFHKDIAWLAEADVTRGCNPPENTEFCPNDNVTREQMAAFMHRLAGNQVVDAGWLNGMTAKEIIDAASTGQSGPVHAATADRAAVAETLAGFDEGEVAKAGPDGDIYNYLVEMDKGDAPAVLAEIGPFTFTGRCEDDLGDTLGVVEVTSSVDFYAWSSFYAAGSVVFVEDEYTAPDDPEYDYWYVQLVAPEPGVYIADDGYDHTIFVEYGDVDCAFAGTFFPHIRGS